MITSSNWGSFLPTPEDQLINRSNKLGVLRSCMCVVCVCVSARVCMRQCSMWTCRLWCVAITGAPAYSQYQARWHGRPACFDVRVAGDWLWSMKHEQKWGHHLREAASRTGLQFPSPSAQSCPPSPGQSLVSLGPGVTLMSGVSQALRSDMKPEWVVISFSYFLPVSSSWQCLWQSRGFKFQWGPAHRFFLWLTMTWWCI